MSRRQLSPKVARYVLLLFMLVGALILGFGLKSVFQAHASTRWPSVTGTVIASEVESRRSNEGGTTYSPEVRYDFSVEGIRYSGNRIAFGDVGLPTPGPARRIVNRYPRGSDVTVFYDAADPDQNVLEPGIRTKTLFLPGFGAVFLIISIVILRAL